MLCCSSSTLSNRGCGVRRWPAHAGHWPMANASAMRARPSGVCCAASIALRHDSGRVPSVPWSCPPADSIGRLTIGRSGAMRAFNTNQPSRKVFICQTGMCAAEAITPSILLEKSSATNSPIAPPPEHPYWITRFGLPKRASNISRTRSRLAISRCRIVLIQAKPVTSGTSERITVREQSPPARSVRAGGIVKVPDECAVPVGRDLHQVPECRLEALRLPRRLSFERRSSSRRASAETSPGRRGARLRCVAIVQGVNGGRL